MRARLTAFALVVLAAAGVAHADDDNDRRRGVERKEEYRDGPCRVEREWKSDGSYREERRCDGGSERYAQRKQEFWDGRCWVKREWKKNGNYKEERRCDDRRRAPPPGRSVVVVAPPPWIVIDKGEPVYRPGREPRPHPHPGPVYQCNSEAVGRVLGGVAGAVIGSQIGKGSDARPIATIGGAILGVLIGGEIGRRMDAENQACIGRALEFGANGQRIAWTASNGAQYAVIPGAAVQRADRYCRPYDAEVLTESGWRRSRATACRAPDGTWAAAG